MEKVTKKTLKELRSLRIFLHYGGYLGRIHKGPFSPGCGVLLPGESLARLALIAASLGAIALCRSRQDLGLYTVVRIHCAADCCVGPAALGGAFDTLRTAAIFVGADLCVRPFYR